MKLTEDTPCQVPSFQKDQKKIVVSIVMIVIHKCWERKDSKLFLSNMEYDDDGVAWCLHQNVLSRCHKLKLGEIWYCKGVSPGYFNVGGQTGKDCLLTWADGVKVADRRDRTRNLSFRKRCTNHCTTGIEPANFWFESQSYKFSFCTHIRTFAELLASFKACTCLHSFKHTQTHHSRTHTWSNP